MAPFADDDAEGTWIAFVDTLFNAMFVFAVMFALQAMLPHLKADESAKRDGVAPGRMCATLMWPDALMVDVDLWARDPAGEVVLYRHRAGRNADLLRDDLGDDPDPASHHFETICSRQLVPGQWTFNAVYYQTHMPGQATPDVPVTIEVAWPAAENPVAPLKASAVLHPGEEITMVDFRLDGSGHVVGSSVNHLRSSMMR